MTAPRPRVRAGSRAARTRARLAVAYRQGDDLSIPTLQRELQIDMAVDYLQQLVDAAPPLTDGQRDRLIALLGGGA
jgi:hypothetical protein